MSTSKSFLLGLVDKLDPQNASHTLTLLSLIVLVEDGQSAPPTIHIQNWLSSFRDLRRSILPTLPEASFWQSVLHLCVDHNMGTPLGRHSVPISIPTSPPEGPFLENVRLHNPASWRQRLTLRTIRYHLWERLAPFHPLEIPYPQFLDVFQKHCPFLFSKQQIRAAYAAFHIA
ncbi:MAG: hypothetical protein VX278_05085, partial [Myxococcota bacterium]|nr:hypothetical protein [Myxococcota bacterium]